MLAGDIHLFLSISTLIFVSQPSFRTSFSLVERSICVLYTHRKPAGDDSSRVGRISIGTTGTCGNYVRYKDPSKF
jgi:hypothetical protein